jgi:hypothetical protein
MSPAAGTRPGPYSFLTYGEYARSSRLAIRAPRSATYASNHCYGHGAEADIWTVERGPS